jgi:hypothetical protein
VTFTEPHHSIFVKGTIGARELSHIRLPIDKNIAIKIFKTYVFFMAKGKICLQQKEFKRDY